MLISITPLLLAATAGSIALLRVLRPGFRSIWLLAIAGATMGLVSALLWVPRLPISTRIPLWQSSISANSFATFAALEPSWQYALGFAMLGISMLLTAPARAHFPSPPNWAICLGMAALGLLSATAESPLTLVLLWAAIDLVEAGVALARRENRPDGARLPFAFGLRLAAIAAVLLGLVLGETGDEGAGFHSIRGTGALLLALAALLRLFALAPPGGTETPIGAGDEVTVCLELAGGAASIAFLCQLSPDAGTNHIVLQLGATIAALYAGWMWLREPEASSGRPYWIVACGSLAVSAVARGNTAASASWGAFMLLAGAAMFFSVPHDRLLSRSLLVTLWMGSALPLSLTAAAWLGGGGWRDAPLPLEIIAQAMILAGVAERAFRSTSEDRQRSTTRSAQLIQRAGVGLPLAAGVLLGLWSWQGTFQLGAALAGAAVLAATAVIVLAKRRFTWLSSTPAGWQPVARRGVYLAAREGVERMVNLLHQRAERITQTMEGEAGILWSLVLLVLFVSLIVDSAR